MKRTLLSLLVTGTISLGMWGCGQSGPDLCEVEGTATLDGQPLTDAELTFVPQNVETTLVSYGRTDEKGHYSLAFTAAKTGAIPATHHVRIEPAGPAKLPKKYRDEASITAEVKKGRNVVDFALTKD